MSMPVEQMSSLVFNSRVHGGSPESDVLEDLLGTLLGLHLTGLGDL